MERRRPIKPCKAAEWSEENNRWNIPPGSGFMKRSQKRIQKRTTKGAREDRVYSQERKWFLALPENSVCPVAAAGLLKDINGELRPHHRAANTVHHAWRRGPYYLNRNTWVAMSWEGNAVWVEANKEEARRRGWLCDTEETRTRWRKAHGGLPPKTPAVK